MYMNPSAQLVYFNHGFLGSAFSAESKPGRLPQGSKTANLVPVFRIDPC